MNLLHLRFEAAARRYPSHVAVRELDGAFITFAALDELAGALAARLSRLGVRPGDRVGVCLPKTIDSVATLLGILKTGAAYVPVDPAAPAARSAYIFADCAVRVLVAEAGAAGRLAPELAALGHEPAPCLVREPGGGRGLRALLAGEPGAAAPASSVAPPAGLTADSLAYILYTSGSTGKPKGVTLTHENATSFVGWACGLIEPTEADRYSSHAPFHFDLSILDLYVPLTTGGTLVLIGEEAGKEPLVMAEAIAREKLTVWYSTPSVLSLMAQYGRLERHDLAALRLVLFAGEVFPVRHLRALMELLPAPRYANLYGPTETNVCNAYEIPKPIPAERVTPFPIGPVCPHVRGRVVDEAGRDVARGAAGELVIHGPAVTRGYWNLPERNAVAFLRDEAGHAWYRTGDIVVEEADGVMTFVGRRDRMVKRRGYRVELGEIEAGLYRHPGVREAAVVALPDEESGVRIRAFLSLQEGTRPSIITFKSFAAQALPAAMVPDLFTFLPDLPHTSTDKIDYQSLKEWP